MDLNRLGKAGKASEKQLIERFWGEHELAKQLGGLHKGDT